MNGWRILLEAARAPVAALAEALRHPKRQQLDLLHDIVSANALTLFGRAHGFASIRSLAEYRAAVPVQSSEAFRPFVEKIAAGESRVLTQDPVVAFEETGGTASGRKLIPYTLASLAGFRAAVLPWLASLAQRRPEITAGSAYVAISPATRQPRRTAGGIAVGLDSDAAYLGDDLAAAFVSILAVPPDVGGLRDMRAWRIATLAHLVERHDLSFVSVWSPTFFLDLIEALPGLADSLAARLSPAARQRLARALAGGHIATPVLWPQLAAISCWTEAGSRGFARRLQALCPHAAMEPKGLLATEAAITLPWGEGPGCVPALTSTFIECIDAAGQPWLAHELQDNTSYTIAITTHGGLYRYAMGDRVRCVSVRDGCPRLVFEGRATLVSDMVGEKLEEAFVASVLNTLGVIAALAPEANHKPHYELWLDDESPEHAALARAVDAALRANPQYAYARDLGQLGPVIAIHRPAFQAHRSQARLAAGHRLGDLKPVCLILDPQS